MRPIICVSLILSGALFSSAAMADWDKTKWGMTPKQVAGVYKAETIEIPSEDWPKMTLGSGSVCKVKIPSKVVADAQFSVLFCFDQADKLSRVTLSGHSSAYNRLSNDLTATYGAPVLKETDAYRRQQWVDNKKGNVISLSMLPLTQVVTVGYGPIPKGL